MIGATINGSGVRRQTVGDWYAGWMDGWAVGAGNNGEEISGDPDYLSLGRQSLSALLSWEMEKRGEE